VRTLSCAEHYRAMAFAQLTYREVCFTPFQIFCDKFSYLACYTQHEHIAWTVHLNLLSGVSQLDSSEARNTAIGAMSEGCPTLPRGVMGIICFSWSLPPPRQLDNDLAEAAAVEMVERVGEGGERIAGVNHGLEVRPVNRRNQILQRPAMADANAMGSIGFLA
jgi:hypothetical protein